MYIIVFLTGKILIVGKIYKIDFQRLLTIFAVTHPTHRNETHGEC